MGWRVEQYTNNISEQSVRVVDEDGGVICDNEPYYPHALDPEHAKLIAAAPDLLEALRNLATEVRHLLKVHPEMDGGLYRQRLSDAEVAIAKAEGHK